MEILLFRLFLYGFDQRHSLALNFASKMVKNLYMCPWILANIYSTMRGNEAQLVGTCAFMLFFSLRFEDLNTIYKKWGLFVARFCMLLSILCLAKITYENRLICTLLKLWYARYLSWIKITSNIFEAIGTDFAKYIFCCTYIIPNENTKLVIDFRVCIYKVNNEVLIIYFCRE